MIRKDFLKILNLGISGLVFNKWKLNNAYADQMNNKKIKNWLWMHPWHNTSDDEYKRRFEKVKKAGIDAIIPNVYAGRKAKYHSRHLPLSEPLLEKLLPLAGTAGLEVHAWIWSMICNNKEIIKNHPDWFAVNRNGESTIEKPAYVGYYRFMCPNQPGVVEFLSKTVNELSAYSELQGIHLDYIRYPDVILAEKLQKKYKISQDKEFPEYDYCYCDNCRSKFKTSAGFDIMETKNPDLDKVWRDFRYESITNLVNNSLVPPAKKKGKIITAAVFPNWEHVRQQWFNWKLDAVFPMLYHKYYNKKPEWIQSKIIEGKQVLDPSTKLFSGLFVDFFNPQELNDTIQESLEAGADGISLFAYHSMKDAHWKEIPQVLNKN